MTPPKLVDPWIQDIKPQVKVPKTVKQAPKITQLPAVDSIHGGQSYRPSHEEHQAVLQLAYDKEMSRIRARDELHQLVPHSEAILRSQR